MVSISVDINIRITFTYYYGKYVVQPVYLLKELMQFPHLFYLDLYHKEIMIFEDC